MIYKVTSNENRAIAFPMKDAMMCQEFPSGACLVPDAIIAALRGNKPAGAISVFEQLELDGHIKVEEHDPDSPEFKAPPDESNLTWNDRAPVSLGDEPAEPAVTDLPDPPLPLPVG